MFMKKFLVVGVVCFFALSLPVWGKETVTAIKAVDLLSVYRGNRIQFNERYLNKTLELSGELLRVREYRGAPVLVIKDGSRVGLIVFCESAELDKAAALVAGKTVTVRGVCKVKLYKVFFEHCVIFKDNARKSRLSAVH
jgi:hypothetical protein